MDTYKQREKREAGIRKVIGALINGRILSLCHSREFEMSEMHTVFCNIRKQIENGQIKGYTMKDRWTTNENGIRYKEYWFEKDGEN